MSEVKAQDFEAALAELERVVSQLEGELKLEDALKLFERGILLSQNCEQFLRTAEQKIEVLKKLSTGAVTTEAFKEEAEAVS